MEWKYSGHRWAIPTFNLNRPNLMREIFLRAAQKPFVFIIMRDVSLGGSEEDVRARFLMDG